MRLSFSHRHVFLTDVPCLPFIQIHNIFTRMSVFFACFSFPSARYHVLNKTESLCGWIAAHSFCFILAYQIYLRFQRERVKKNYTRKHMGYFSIFNAKTWKADNKIQRLLRVNDVMGAPDARMIRRVLVPIDFYLERASTNVLCEFSFIFMNFLLSFSVVLYTNLCPIIQLLCTSEIISKPMNRLITNLCLRIKHT